MQCGEGIEPIEEVAQQLRRRRLLTGNGLRQLRKVKAQGQGLQIPPQAVEQLQCGALVGVVPLSFLVEGPLGPHQRLGRSSKFTALAAGAPGDDGDASPLRRQHRQNFVRFLGLRLPQYDAPKHQIRRGRHVRSLPM